MKNVFLKTMLLSSACLVVSCADQTVPSTVNGYWNVVLAGNSMATLYFSHPVSTPIVAGGSTIGTAGNLYVSGGGTTGCRMASTGGTVIVGGTNTPAGNQTGSFTFSGLCINYVTSNLTVTLGNSTTAVLDSLNHTIVSAGQSVSATIVAPGATGASSNNVYY